MVIVIDLITLIVFGIIGLGIFYFLLVLFHSWKLRRQRKKYREEEDLSKLGEKRKHREKGNFGTTATDGTTFGRESIVEGFNKFERGEFLPTTDVIPSGENINSSGKPNKTFRKFKRLK